MSDTVAPVLPIRPGLAARYGDGQAMNDIHSLLTGPGGLTGEEVAACVAEIVARAGRSLEPARVITAKVTEDGRGMPVARVDADGTVALVSQDPDGPGVLIHVTTRDAAESARLVVTIDGRPVSHSPLRHVRPRQPGRVSRQCAADRDQQPPDGRDEASS